MLTNPSLKWEPLDDVFYRSRLCYEDIKLPIQSNFDDYNIVIGPSSSVLAIYPKKHSPIRHSLDNILITTSNGDILHSISWDFNRIPISSIEWTPNAELLLILSSGKFRLYYNYTGDFKEYSILDNDNGNDNDKTDNNETIISSKISNYTLALQTNLNEFIIINDIRRPSRKQSYKQFKTDSSIDPYHISTWNILDDSIILSTSSSLSILSNNLISNILPSGAYTKISISYNHSLVSLLTIDNKIEIYNSDFSKLLLTSLLSNSQVLDIQWCSNDVLVLSYSTHLMILGPSNDSISILTNSKPLLKSETDGLFYFTGDQLFFFSKVNINTEKIFRIGSTDPAAILLDSIQYLDNHSPKANDLLDLISDQLPKAIDDCINAALEEFEPYWQKILLRAANFGKINLDLYDPSDFINSCNILRILNLLRNNEIGIFISYNQYLSLGIEKLIDWLLLRNLHYLCLKITDLLNLPNYKIKTHWACCKLKNSHDLNDNQLLNLLADKLKNDKIDWLNLSNIAFIEGRFQLSKNLISFEPNTGKKVQFLISIHSKTNGDEMLYALTKANEDSDADSLLLILFELFSSLSNIEFFKAINDKQNAIGLLKSIQYQQSSTLLNDFMYQDDDIYGLIIIYLKKHFINTDKVKMDNKHYTHIETLFSKLNKSNTLLSSLVTKYKTSVKVELDLNNHQLELSNVYPTIKPGDSLFKTLSDIVVVDLKVALSFAKKYNISSNQIITTVLQSLAPITSKHAQLFEFATSNSITKSYPLETFYYHLFKLNMKRQASMYLPYCKQMSYKEKIIAYINCDQWKEAVNQAAGKNDIPLLRQMRDSRIGNDAKIANDQIELITGKRESI
ncbi:tethering complex subunit [Pichia kluyveri]|uniref:Probable vacuolar protein sorting-associated protein 16 homolog n=1 Tax=Pichia kluyveri TaxID=36015 RepID=A0AAV5R156_PICKL|nr:tethering complex subunit [Pichia kluyveri]